MTFLKRLFYFLLLCLWSTSLYGQDFLVNTQFFTVKDGLSDRAIFTIVQDNRGLIWVGTGNGLNRFDGAQFTRIEDPDMRLSSGAIEGIKKGKDGLLWIQKIGESVIVFDPVKEVILPITAKIQEQYGDLEILNSRGKGDIILLRNNQGKAFLLNEQNQVVFMES